MAKYFHDDVLDAAANKVATGTHAVVCSSQPGNYAGIAAVTLATVTVTAGHGNGDWTVQNGAVSGRRATLAAQNGVEVLESDAGETLHLAIDDGTTLLAVTTITVQPLTDGNTVDIPETDFEFRDPS